MILRTLSVLLKPMALLHRDPEERYGLNRLSLELRRAATAPPKPLAAEIPISRSG
jgi:hypothetical protein